MYLRLDSNDQLELKFSLKHHDIVRQASATVDFSNPSTVREKLCTACLLFSTTSSPSGHTDISFPLCRDSLTLCVSPSCPRSPLQTKGRQVLKTGAVVVPSFLSPSIYQTPATRQTFAPTPEAAGGKSASSTLTWLTVSSGKQPRLKLGPKTPESPRMSMCDGKEKVTLCGPQTVPSYFILVHPKIQPQWFLGKD